MALAAEYEARAQAAEAGDRSAALQDNGELRCPSDRAKDLDLN